MYVTLITNRIMQKCHIPQILVILEEIGHIPFIVADCVLMDLEYAWNNVYNFLVKV